LYGTPRDYPQLLNRVGVHSHFFQEGSLRLLHLLQIGLCVKIQSRLNFRMTKDPLHSFRILLAFVDQPVDSAVAEALKAGPTEVP
jgi:hypothetical protein